MVRCHSLKCWLFWAAGAWWIGGTKQGAEESADDGAGEKAEEHGGGNRGKAAADVKPAIELEDG